MIWKSTTRSFILLVTTFMFAGSLYANQQNPYDKCQYSTEISGNCELTGSRYHSSLLHSIVSYEPIPENREATFNQNPGVICCDSQDPVLGMFSLESIVQGLLIDPEERKTGWSIYSNLFAEYSQSEVRKEIELTDVDEELGMDENGSPVNADQYEKNGKPCAKFDSSNRKQNPKTTDKNGQDPQCSEKPLKTLVNTEPGYDIPDIPVYTNKRIEAFINLYTKKKRKAFMRAIERLPKYQDMITKTFKEYELPLNLTYLAIVESNLNPNAISRANAVGLWQFMSYTGKHFGLSRSWWHDDRYDPERSTVAAAKYLKQLHKRFKGDWELALAAYNSGSGTVNRAIRRAKKQGKATDYWSLKLPRETRGYVPAFYAVSIIFADLEKYGFKSHPSKFVIEPKQQLDVGGGIALNQLAKLFKVEPDVLKELNPRLRFRGLTPPTLSSFNVALPASLEVNDDHLKQLNDLKQNKHEKWKVHRVRQGETLWSISRYYRIPLNKILAYNRLKRKNILRIGQKLMLPVPIDWNPPKIPSKTKLALRDIDKLPGVTKIHVVQKGETLWRISQMYNVPIRKIKHWNRRVLRHKYLKIGTEIVLKVPLSVASKPI